jgi:hypothetical protein
MFKNRKKPLPEILNNFKQHIQTLGFDLSYEIEMEQYITHIMLQHYEKNTTGLRSTIIKIDKTYYYDRQSVLLFKEAISRLVPSLTTLFETLQQTNADEALIQINCDPYRLILHFEPDLYVYIPYSLSGNMNSTDEPIKLKAIVPIGSTSSQSMALNYIPSEFTSTINIINEYGYPPRLEFCLQTTLSSNTYNKIKVNPTTWKLILNTVEKLNQVAMTTYTKNLKGVVSNDD